ncbi:50S ribosomal protein L23 [Buchnera aphidicola (Phyllaphis fagi)]|uniref:50S ribosomal protein L23 n=1 Tax=Buchnera aphidicola TaxID=9 RepID=UPI0034645971
MISQEKLFKILYTPHISEKSSIFLNKNNTVTFKVSVKSTKLEIKLAMQELFSVDIKGINTVLVKGKIKKKGKYNIYKKHWKKAYITLQKGQKLDCINDV